MSRREQSPRTERVQITRRGAWGPIFGAAVLVAAGSSIAWMHQHPIPAINGHFKLIDAQTGRQVTKLDFRGKWLLIFFGYTHCADVCPATLNAIAESMKQLGSLADQVQPLFITVDPKRDTSKVLVDYTADFDPRIIGLTGGTKQIAAAAKSFHVYYAGRAVGADEDFDHNAVINVVRPDGTYAPPFLPATDSMQMTARLRRLIGSQS